MDKEIITMLAQEFLKSPTFLKGFIAGSFVMLVFRSEVVRFVVRYVLRLSNGKKKES